MIDSTEELFAAFEDPYNCIKFIYGTPSHDDNGNPYFDEGDMNQLAGYIDDLRKQRDDLLAACEELLEQHGWMPDGVIDPEPTECDCLGCLQARVAIAVARPATEPSPR